MVDAEYKLQKNIKIAMLYLEDDDAVNAETFIKKAATLITGTKVLLPCFCIIAGSLGMLTVRIVWVLYPNSTFTTADKPS